MPAVRTFLPECEHVEILAGFGDARRVRCQEGKYRLDGGSAADRKEAEDWIRRFSPELVGLCTKEAGGRSRPGPT